jgi:hypothetical protein
MSDQLQVPAALSPEERRADNPSPLSLSLSLWRSYKTSTLNQEKYNTAISPWKTPETGKQVIWKPLDDKSDETVF